MINTGLKWDDLQRFIREQIYTLPSIGNHKKTCTRIEKGYK